MSKNVLYSCMTFYNNVGVPMKQLLWDYSALSHSNRQLGSALHDNLVATILFPLSPNGCEAPGPAQ